MPDRTDCCSAVRPLYIPIRRDLEDRCEELLPRRSVDEAAEADADGEADGDEGGEGGTGVDAP
jgi:hypothetical protein